MPAVRGCGLRRFCRDDPVDRLPVDTGRRGEDVAPPRLYREMRGAHTKMRARCPRSADVGSGGFVETIRWIVFRWTRAGAGEDVAPPRLYRGLRGAHTKKRARCPRSADVGSGGSVETIRWIVFRWTRAGAGKTWHRHVCTEGCGVYTRRSGQDARGPREWALSGRDSDL